MRNDWDGTKPDKDEYGPFYHDYVVRVGSGNIIDILIKQMHEVYTLINSLTPDQAAYRYEEEKWTVKEVFGHLIDTERVFAYRALRFSRGDRNDLPGFDQEEYVEKANFNERSLQNLGNEYFAQRNANVHLFSSFTKKMIANSGTADGNNVSVCSIPFIIAGHELHHLETLKAKYKLVDFIR